MNTKVKLIKASNTGARNRNALDLDLKRVAAYCRVSTDSKDQLESYKSQVDYYTNLIKNNKNWTLAGIYADEATTGTTATKRADFMRLISDCQNGDIDMIITKSISRFARNTLDTLKYVRLLKENNVGVVFEEGKYRYFDNGWRAITNNIKFSSSTRSRKYLSPCKKRTENENGKRGTYWFSRLPWI